MATEAIEAFINDWADGPENCKQAFCEFKEFLASQEGVTFDFVPRPGVTYSLRASHANQTKRKMFAMVDVIEGEPRWLSVCFYGELVADPEERGDFVPGGLLGEDAACFDLETYEPEAVAYVRARLDEAAAAASADK